MTTTHWRVSSFCSAGGCVTARQVDDRIEVADSKHPTGPRLVFTTAEWAAFLAGVKAGEFDPPSD